MPLPTTIEECHKLILDLQATVEILMSKLVIVDELQARIKELENQLKQNSQNSHRPPSSDGYGKQPAIPRKKGGRRGGKPGHKGKTLEMVETPDVIEPLRPVICSCGRLLEKQDMELLARRQVFDLPQPKLEVTEYQVYGCSCPKCHKWVQGQFPQTVTAPVQYGPGVKALSNLLYTGHHLSHQSIGELFRDMYGYELNEGTIQAATEHLHTCLEDSERHIKELVSQSPVAHFDETGQRVAGKLHWLHVAATQALTYLFVHPNRGQEALESDASILPYYMGTAIHDCLPVYFAYLMCFHGLCASHLLRELNALMEQGSRWAGKMYQLIFQLYEACDYGRGKVDNIEEWRKKYDRICRRADREEPPPEQKARGRPKKTKGRNLLERFIEHRPYILAFAEFEDIPFTNNLAERDLRPAKIKQKVSGCFRTLEGAQRFARIRGFISTARKQSRNVFKELLNAINGQSFVLQLAPLGT
jgi:transposase